jgi:hypothetical protein
MRASPSLCIFQKCGAPPLITAATLSAPAGKCKACGRGRGFNKRIDELRRAYRVMEGGGEDPRADQVYRDVE